MSIEMNQATTESAQTDTDIDGTPPAREPDNTETPEPQSKREARYRLQLRETEAERDTLAGRIETMQRAEVERLAADVIAKPDALWASDTTLADLLDDDGLVDRDKVTAAAYAAKDTLGLELGAAERKKRGPVVPREGTGTGHSSHNAWKDAFSK
ncbi:hypothetical protein RD149_17795 [Gordonia westfalica]|uniref:Uncharacterized protein n=1 Tax=Gordonia westfalica TaxID=158898 RepID=A0ABU2GVX2_9ACTN|nr:hypothetical protein [Gordonia westfalica]MDS1115607.1 hypothetical protein [Gordonia westfalica]